MSVCAPAYRLSSIHVYAQSMLFSIFMLDPVIRLMNCMLEKAKKDNFRFDVTPESTYSARGGWTRTQPTVLELTMRTDERGRLDYKVWLCKDHDEVERSLKTALSQVKVSATSLKGSCTSGHLSTPEPFVTSFLDRPADLRPNQPSRRSRKNQVTNKAFRRLQRARQPQRTRSRRQVRRAPPRSPVSRWGNCPRPQRGTHDSARGTAKVLARPFLWR